MNLPKLLILVSILLFGLIGLLAIFKKEPSPPAGAVASQAPIEIDIPQENLILSPVLASEPVKREEKQSLTYKIDLPEANRIEEFFNRNGEKLPIVETITYKSHVPWQKGRPAWLSDYAAHYQTSRHFIARSLNGKSDYFKQELSEGDQFNVLSKDKDFEFYLVVDTSRCRMWFYYIDLDNHEKILLKTYPVGLGRLDGSKTSGLLTPLGTYSLGERIAIYKPKNMGMHQNKKIEMMTIFGTRWIPFDEEIKSCTAPAKGLGIHGTPWAPGGNGELTDNSSSIGKYESDGCIRLTTPDIEELFAIIITKRTTIEIVPDFRESSIMKSGF